MSFQRFLGFRSGPSCLSAVHSRERTGMAAWQPNTPSLQWAPCPRLAPEACECDLSLNRRNVIQQM